MIEWVILVLTLLQRHECPPDMVRIPGSDSCIDQYEWPNLAGELPAIGLSAMPVGRETGQDIDSLCRSVGKRVCEIGEWVAACRGPHEARYPWGNKLPPPPLAPCNYSHEHISVDEAKVAARDPVEMARLDHRDASGARGCISASGAEDMMGNVEEWVRCPGVGRYGWCLAGRYWGEPEPCNRMVTVHAPRWFFYETGGRCCR